MTLEEKILKLESLLKRAYAIMNDGEGMYHREINGPLCDEWLEDVTKYEKET